MIKISLVFLVICLFVLKPNLVSGSGKIYHGLSNRITKISVQRVWAWGDNTYGELGNGTDGDVSLVAILVSGLSNVVQIATGDYHALALFSNGSMAAWGDNTYGKYRLIKPPEETEI